jgi:hypothetical protein
LGAVKIVRKLMDSFSVKCHIGFELL